MDQKAEDLFRPALDRFVGSLGGNAIALNVWLADERLGDSLAGRCFVGTAASAATSDRARRLQQFFENPSTPPPRIVGAPVDAPLMKAMAAFDEEVGGLTGMVVVLHHEHTAEIALALPEDLSAPLERLAIGLMARIPVAATVMSPTRAKRIRRRRWR